MIEVKKFNMPEVVPQDELMAWRSGLKKSRVENCPPEVEEFISAVAAKLPDFGQIGQFHTAIAGKELHLSGMKHFNGEPIDPWTVYHLPVPRMVAVDHHTWMHRIFNRKGKQGLINYCRAQVKGTHLQQLLDILNVQVFHQERPEFTAVMDEIKAAKKLESKIDV